LLHIVQKVWDGKGVKNELFRQELNDRFEYKMSW
jgi:hypothetical protein